MPASRFTNESADDSLRNDECPGDDDAPRRDGSESPHSENGASKDGDLDVAELHKRSNIHAKWRHEPGDAVRRIDGYLVGPGGVVDAENGEYEDVAYVDNSNDANASRSLDTQTDAENDGDDDSESDWPGLRQRLKELEYRHRQRIHLGPCTSSGSVGAPAGSYVDKFAESGNEGEDKDRYEEAIEATLENKRQQREEAAEASRRATKARDDFSWSKVNIHAFLANEHDRKEEEWGTDYNAEIDQNNRKTPDSEEFLRETQGKVPEALFVDVDRFLTLPRRAVDDIVEGTYGGLTYGDTVNTELPALSYIAGLQAEQPDGRRTIDYDHGQTVVVEDDEIIVSKQKVARAIAQRFYFYPTPRGPAVNENTSFHALYRSVSRAINDLSETPVLDHNGPAIETGDKTSDAFGQRYSVNLPGLQSLPYSSSAPVMLFQPKSHSTPSGHYIDEFSLELESTTEVVDVGAMFDELVAGHTSQWSTFTEQAAKSTTASKDSRENFRTNERGVKGFQWQRRQARESTVHRDDNKENSRHVTTGAFKEKRSTHVERKHLPCTVPFVVLEIDGQTPQLCLEYTRRIVRWLDSINVPLDSATVTYTGNQSFHTRLPAGLFGKPIFRSAQQAKKTLRELYSLIEDNIDRLGGAHVDSMLASPLHHIRAIGSVHEGRYSREEKTRYCVGFTAKQVLQLPLNGIREFAIRYDGYTLPRPGDAGLNERLQGLLRKAHKRSQQTYETNDDRSTSRGIVDKIYREGVEKGEEFHDGLTGRNHAARLVSLYLLQSGCSVQDAWTALKDWNQKNSPPIGDATDDYNSELRYIFEKAEEDAPRL